MKTSLQYSRVLWTLENMLKKLHFSMHKCERVLSARRIVWERQEITECMVSSFKKKLWSALSLGGFNHLSSDCTRTGMICYPSNRIFQKASEPDKLGSQNPTLFCPTIFRVRKHGMKYPMPYADKWTTPWSLLTEFFWPVRSLVKNSWCWLYIETNAKPGLLYLSAFRVHSKQWC